MDPKVIEVCGWLLAGAIGVGLISALYYLI